MTLLTFFKRVFLESDHLFEVAVEVNFSQDLDTSWDHVALSLLLSLKSLVKPQLLVSQEGWIRTSCLSARVHAEICFILLITTNLIQNCWLVSTFCFYTSAFSITVDLQK